jgi:PD-(D/E)XK endonuclease
LAKKELKADAIRLRVEERKSYSEIKALLRISNGSLTKWLGPYPLSDEEKKKRQAEKAARQIGRRWKCPVVSIESVPFDAKPSAHRLRESAVGYAIAWFMSRGYMPSLPVGLARYDLVVDDAGSLKKVQVKTTTSKNDYENWEVGVHRMAYDRKAKLNAAGRKRRVAYSDSDVDVFFIVTGAGDVYLIPRCVVGNRMYLSLGGLYERYKVGRLDSFAEPT